MKSKKYTLKYKTDIDGKMKTITKDYANLKEARKEGVMYFDTFVSLRNAKGTNLPL